MKKALKWLDENVELICLMLLLASLVVIMFYQIIRRYVFNSSLTWSEEYCRYAFIWFMFLAFSYSIRLKSDLRVDAVVNLLPEGAKKALDFIDVLISFALTVLLFTASITTVKFIHSTGDVSTGLHLPMYFVYLAMPVGFGLATIRYIQRIIQDIRKMTGKEKKEVEG